MNIKRDIKLWKRFFGNWHFYGPTVRIFLSDGNCQMRVIEGTKEESLLSVDLECESDDKARFTLNPNDAQRLGTALLGYANAWQKRNQDAHRGYRAIKTEEIEKELGISKKNGVYK